LYISFVLTAYVAGAATGAPTLEDALRALLNHPSSALVGGAILCAAMGLLFGAPHHSSRGAKGAGGILLLTALGMSAMASTPGDPEHFREYLTNHFPESASTWISGALMLVSLIVLSLPRPYSVRIPVLTCAVGIALLLIFYAGADGGTSQLWKALSGSPGQLLLALLLALGAWVILPVKRTTGPDVDRRSRVDEGTFTSTPT
jgi:hypothetical protein